MRDLVHLVACLTGFEGEFIWDCSKPEGQPRRCLDTSKAERLFGFRAKIPAEEGLRRMIEWYNRSVATCRGTPRPLNRKCWQARAR